MNENAPKWAVIIFILALLVSAFFVTGQYINYYRFKLTGALYELLSLPFLLLMLLIPVFSLIQLRKVKFNLRSLYLYSLFIIVLTIIFLTFFR